MSLSVENFVKTIYKYEQQTHLVPKATHIASELKITKAAASDMSRKLSERDLIIYEKYKTLQLTTKGRKMALSVIRKHRLWETFLQKTLNLSLHEIHREAEMLEHMTSDFLADKIDDYLGNPKTDPHGDPIPDYNGDITYSDEDIVLSSAQPGNYYTISRLFSSDEDFFDFCNSNQITIGSTIKVEKQYDSKKMTGIAINNNRILLNQEFTHVIYVKQLQKS